MLYYRSFCCSMLVLAVLGANLNKAGAGELVKPALNEGSEQLSDIVSRITSQSRESYERLSVSQEVVKELEAVLNLIASNLFEVIEDYEGCHQTLELLDLHMCALYKAKPLVEDYYAHLYQDDVNFLHRLGESYRQALKNISKIMGLWGKYGFGAVDALARFLGASIETLRLDCEMGVYYESIYHASILKANPEPLHHNQEGASGPDQGAERVEQIVFANYEALARRITGLFGEMIKGLESILSGLEGPERADEAYLLFQFYLEHCFEASVTNSPKCVWNERKVLNNGEQRGSSEVQASLWISIFRQLLDFKLKFPGMDHTIGLGGRLFSVYIGYTGFLDDDPPLIIKETMKKLLTKFELVDVPSSLGEDPAAGISRLASRLNWLKMWIYTFYWRLEGASLMPDKRTRKYLMDVEENLCMILEAVESADGQVGLWVLGGLIRVLESMAVVIERILRMLYVAKKLQRGKGQPGHFLTKLRQVTSMVLREGPSVKNAQSTQRPKELQGGGNYWYQQEGESGCLADSEPYNNSGDEDSLGLVGVGQIPSWGLFFSWVCGWCISNCGRSS